MEEIQRISETQTTMRQPPQVVVHINFLPGVLMFQPERVWTALRRARESGKVTRTAADSILAALGGNAIHLATREYVLRAAVTQLRNSLAALGNMIPAASGIPLRHGYRVVGDAQVYPQRDLALLAVDSVLFEFRSYLELLAVFVYELHIRTGNRIPARFTHSSGNELVVIDKRGKMKTHSFLRYLCERLSCSEEWYLFLSEHRNFFTHEGAPYIAIEDRLMIPTEFDFLIMRTNIHDFASADRQDYFRLSELQEVVSGVRRLARAAQEDLVSLLES